jgi:hypothetical protein
MPPYRPPFLSRDRRGCRERRLAIPSDLPVPLGCDAVGMPAEHGQRIIDALPRTGCVFADDRRWWWIVPSGSHIGVVWPGFTRYAVGARVAAPLDRGSGRFSHCPRLIHRADDSPYTPPLPLYFVARHIAAANGLS